MAEAKRHFDIAVIGAGINGAGIARDAALRGLSVIVLEQSDLCSGTSWASSRLIHGGLRYLEYGEIGLVYESLHERRNLRRVAAHLVKPLRICIPIYESAKRGPLLIRLGMIAYDVLSYGKSLPGAGDILAVFAQGHLLKTGAAARSGARLVHQVLKTVTRIPQLEDPSAAGVRGGPAPRVGLLLLSTPS